MAWLLHIPVLFVAVKLIAMTAVCVWLWRNKYDKKANVASWVAAAVYGAIAIYYICWGFVVKIF